VCPQNTNSSFAVRDLAGDAHGAGALLQGAEPLRRGAGRPDLAPDGGEGGGADREHRSWELRGRREDQWFAWGGNSTISLETSQQPLGQAPPLLSYKTQTSTSWGVKSAIARFVNHLFNFSSFYLNTPLQRNGLAQTIEIPTKRHEFVVAGPEISIIRACFPFWC